MKFYLILLLNFCELLAVISGFWHWKKVKNSYWKYFPVYLLIILLVELTGKYFNIVLHQSAWNAYLYYYFGIPVQFLFFFWLFSKQGDNRNLKLLSTLSISIYIISWIMDFLFLSKIEMWFTSFSYTIGNLLLVLLIINYLLKFINSDEILNYKSSIMFWVAIGVAIFYLGTLPFFALRNTLYYEYRSIFTVYNYVQLILDCLMYLVFALAFIWGKPKSLYS